MFQDYLRLQQKVEDGDLTKENEKNQTRWMLLEGNWVSAKQIKDNYFDRDGKLIYYSEQTIYEPTGFHDYFVSDELT